MQIHLSLMNNEPQSFDNIRGFIMDTKSHVYSLVFFSGIDFCCAFPWLKFILLFLALIGTLLPLYLTCF